jgi:hypothetical protein
VALLAGPVPDDELAVPLDDELAVPLDDVLVTPLDDVLVTPLEDVLVALEVVPDPPFEEVVPAAPPAPGRSPPPHAESNATTEPPTRSK